MKRAYLIPIMTILLLACRQNPVQETAADSVKVRVTTVDQKKIKLPVHSTGVIMPASQVKLAFKTGGLVAGVYAEEGSKVKKGDVLAVLNLSEIEAQEKQARNGYDKSLRDYQRATNLYTDSVITLEMMQNAETAMNVAKASLDIATFNLNHSRIEAPDDGIILQRMVEKDEVIGPGYPAFVFGTTRDFWKIESGLADKDFVKIQIGDSASVFVDAYPGNTFYATVSLVGESADPYTGTYEVELDMEPAEEKMAPGFVANLEIYPSQARDLFLVPVEALVEAENTSGYLFMVDESMKARKITVNIVEFIDDQLAVEGDLNAVKRIVTEGAAFLDEGDHVLIVE